MDTVVSPKGRAWGLVVNEKAIIADAMRLEIG